MKLELNCDLGEGEPFARARALMRRIDSANVACGGHAGNTASMEACCRLAIEFKVKLGAHPGLHSDDFGRGGTLPTPAQLNLLLLHQIAALEKVAAFAGISLHHIKLHGSLYHAVEHDHRLAEAYLETAGKWWPKLKIYALAGGRLCKMARNYGLEAWPEAFADRAYRDDCSLLPRSEKGAVIHEIERVKQRVSELLETSLIRSVSGKSLNLAPRTLCIHSDTPDATKLAEKLARLLR